MTACAPPRQAEDLGRQGAWRFSRHRVVGPELLDQLWVLYEAAFGDLRTRSMARQVLTAAEFADQMANAAVRKYVGWDDDGDPVGLCMVTDDLDTVPWISPEYFAARFPEQWQRRAIWYVSCLLAHPSQRHSRFLDHILDLGVGEAVAEQAVCAYDMCLYNHADLQLSRRVEMSFERATGVAPRLADAQNYYTVDLSGAAGGQDRSAGGQDPSAAGQDHRPGGQGHGKNSAAAVGPGDTDGAERVVTV